MIIDKMTNNYYKILSFMYDEAVLLNGEYMVPYTQAELSQHLKINKVSINKMFRAYTGDELIYRLNSKYYLTEKAVRIIKKVKAIHE